jgi:hypothetical protein
LKPDACRRVVGRLPSPHIQGSLQKPLWFQQHGMAPPFSFSLPERSLKTMVVYLVRSLGLMPEFVSHDWHVQPSCQRPNRGPPRRREFSPGELATRANPTVLETLQTYSAAENPVNHRFPQNFQMISTSGIAWSGTGELPAEPRKQIPHDKAVRNDKTFGLAL